MSEEYYDYRQAFDHPLLSGGEELALLRRAVGGDAEAVASLVQHNQRLILSVALRYYYAGMAGDLSLQDLVQVGNIALLEVIQRWDLGKDVRFSTFASHWLRAHIRRYAMTKGQSFSRSARDGDIESRLRRAISDLHVRLERPPTVSEVSAATGISKALVREHFRLMRAVVVSLDHRDGSSADDDDLSESIPGGGLLEEDVQERLDQTALHRALDDLPPRWAEVIRLRYLCDPGQPYSQIARQLGISRQRATEIEQQALERLRAALATPENKPPQSNTSNA